MTVRYQSTEDRTRAGETTRTEIFQQPELWPTTIKRMRDSGQSAAVFASKAVVLAGAGSSAYAAAAIALSWPGSQAIATTDLLVKSPEEIERTLPKFTTEGVLISVARSGQSPESAAVIAKLQRHFPAVQHVVITCNAEGRIARMPGVTSIVLDPRTNDKSLVMTSSFSNLVLAGLCLNYGDGLAGTLATLCEDVRAALPRLDEIASEIATNVPERVAVLASADLGPLAQEVSLKILEMTAGSISALPETFLGLRHGPMSFLRPDSLVLCFLSRDARRRRYEEDLMQELREKRLGRVVAIGPENVPAPFSEIQVPGMSAELPDFLRTPFEVPFGQMLAYHLSLKCGLNPDNPSPEGVITRVVQGFRIHDESL
ncbi:MAG: hypothetical protein JOY54_06390 [Acidobacteriaceae bacterium]|nr:hypothetical protein [Acidobacteriaceae bacterium]